MPHITQIAYRCKIAINDGASQAFVDLDGFVLGAIPGESVEVVDTTPLDSASGYKTKMPNGFKETKNLKFQVFYSAFNFSRIQALVGKRYQAANVPTKFRVSPYDPDGAGTELADIATYEGFVMDRGEIGFNKSADATMMEVEVVPSGPPTFTSATQGTGTP